MSPTQERQLHIIKRTGLKLRVFRSELDAQMHSDALASLLARRLVSFGTKPTEADVRSGDAVRIFVHANACLGGSNLAIATLTHAVQIATITADILLYTTNQFTTKRAHSYESLRPLALTIVEIPELQQALETDHHPGGIADGVFSYVKAVSYETSALLAAQHGTFPTYKSCSAAMLAAITNHRAAAFGDGSMLTDSHIRPPMLREGHVPALLLTKTRERWNSALALGNVHGYRNAKTVALTAVQVHEEKQVTIPKDVEQKWRTRTPLSQEELQQLLRQ